MCWWCIPGIYCKFRLLSLRFFEVVAQYIRLREGGCHGSHLDLLLVFGLPQRWVATPIPIGQCIAFPLPISQFFWYFIALVFIVALLYHTSLLVYIKKTKCGLIILPFPLIFSKYLNVYFLFFVLLCFTYRKYYTKLQKKKRIRPIFNISHKISRFTKLFGIQNLDIDSMVILFTLPWRNFNSKKLLRTFCAQKKLFAFFPQKAKPREKKCPIVWSLNSA